MPYRDIEDEREYQRQHYLRNQKLYKDRARISRIKTRAERREYVKNLKESSPCMDCGVYYPYYVMDFDHRGLDKEEAVARLVNSGGMKKLLAEIEKCDLVCSNCHRERTQARLSQLAEEEVLKISK